MLLTEKYPINELREAMSNAGYGQPSAAQFLALFGVIEAEDLFDLVDQNDAESREQVRALCAAVSGTAKQAYDEAGLEAVTTHESVAMHRAFGSDIRRVIRAITDKAPGLLGVAISELQRMYAHVQHNPPSNGFTLKDGEAVPVQDAFASAESQPVALNKTAGVNEDPGRVDAAQEALTTSKEEAHTEAPRPAVVEITNRTSTLLFGADMLVRQEKATVFIEGLHTEKGVRKSIRVQFTVRELPRLLAMLQGWTADQQFRNHGQRQDKHVLARQIEAGVQIELRDSRNSISFVMSRWDCYSMASIVIMQMSVNDPHLKARDVLVMTRHQARSELRYGKVAAPEIAP